MRIGGGATVSSWYGYDRAWQRLRGRSDWIEMGASTPQIDAFSDARDPGGLIRYVEDTSGVLDAAAVEDPGQLLRLLDRDGADEHGLTLFVPLHDVVDERVPLLVLVAVDLVLVVDPETLARSVGKLQRMVDNRDRE